MSASDLTAAAPLPLPVEAEPGVPEILLLPRPLLFASLPYRSGETEVTRRARVGADAYLTVTYTAIDPAVGLPYGSDRALLAWLSTQGYRTGTAGFAALRDYLKACHLDTGGGSYRTLRARLRRLANLRIRLDLVEEGVRTSREFPFLDGGELLQGASPHARYEIRLDPAYAAYLRTTSVPLPLPVVRLVHHSPQAWDLVAFVLYRCFAARRPSVVPWPSLIEQLGTQDGDDYRLKHRLGRILAWLRWLYPDCPAQFLPGLRGLAVAPWKLPERPAHLIPAEARLDHRPPRSRIPLSRRPPRTLRQPVRRSRDETWAAAHWREDPAVAFHRRPESPRRGSRGRRGPPTR